MCVSEYEWFVSEYPLNQKAESESQRLWCVFVLLVSYMGFAGLSIDQPLLLVYLFVFFRPLRLQQLTNNNVVFSKLHDMLHRVYVRKKREEEKEEYKAGRVSCH